MIQKVSGYLKQNFAPSFPRRTRVLFLFLTLGFFVLFILFTLLVRIDVLRTFDFDTTVKLQARIPLRVDPFFSWLSVIGRFETTFIIFMIILFLKRKILGIIAFGLFGFAHVIEVIGKSILSQPGPPHMFLRTHELAQEFPGFYIHTQASYPSGHAMRTIFLSILIGLLVFRSKKVPPLIKIFVYIFLICVVVLMVISRVSLGEHWATDVIGGALLGASFALLALLFL